MDLERDEGLLLLKRYNECLELEDKPGCREFNSDSNNNKKSEEGKDQDLKKNSLDTPSSGGNHSQTDDESMDESDLTNVVVDGNDDENRKRNGTISPKNASNLNCLQNSEEPTIVRPIPTNPFSLSNQQRRSPYIAPIPPTDHTGLLTFLDEAKRRAFNTPQPVSMKKDVLDINLDKDHKKDSDRSVYPNAEFRRTSAPACLWSAVSMLNNPPNNQNNINDLLMVSH